MSKLVVALQRIERWWNELPNDLSAFVPERGIPHIHFDDCSMSSNQWSYVEMFEVVSLVAERLGPTKSQSTLVLIIEEHGELTANELTLRMQEIMGEKSKIDTEADVAIAPPQLVVLDNRELIDAWSHDAICSKQLFHHGVEYECLALKSLCYSEDSETTMLFMYARPAVRR